MLYLRCGYLRSERFEQIGQSLLRRLHLRHRIVRLFQVTFNRLHARHHTVVGESSREFSQTSVDLLLRRHDV
jgi:hypothetical protein